jgi:hypothetical protein
MIGERARGVLIAATLTLTGSGGAVAQGLSELQPGARVRVITLRPGLRRVEGRLESANPAQLVVRRGASLVTLPLQHPDVVRVEVLAGRRGLAPVLVAAAGAGALVGGVVGWYASKPAGCGDCGGKAGMTLAAAAAGGLAGVGLSFQFGPRQWRVVFHK